jgi:hypothetical protein
MPVNPHTGNASRTHDHVQNFTHAVYDGATNLAEESKSSAQQPDDAWLEEALLLAASELAAFRATAQVERERLLRADEDMRARLHALEHQLRKVETQHLTDLAEARGLLDNQLMQRAQAWDEFGRDLKQRMASLAQAEQQHALDVEETSLLRRQLHDARAELSSSREGQTELESRLSASEESFAVAAAELQKVKDDVASNVAQRAELSRELTASASHCAQLQAERRVNDERAAENEAARTGLERRVEQLSAELLDAQANLRELAQLREELSQLLPLHKALEQQAAEQAGQLMAAKAELDRLVQVSQALEQLKAAHASLQRRAEQQHGQLSEANLELARLTQVAQEHAQLSLAHKALQGRAEEGVTRLLEAQSELARLTHTSEELGQLRIAHEGMQRRAENALSQLADAQAEIVRLTQAREDLARLQLAHADIGTQLKAAEAELARMNRVTQELEALSAAHATVQQEIVVAQAELAGLRSQVAQLPVMSQEVDRLCASLEQARLQHLGLQSELTQATERMDRAARENAEAQQLAEASREAVAAAAVRVQESQADVHAARRERDQVREGLESKYKSELAAAQSELEQLRRQPEQMRDAPDNRELVAVQAELEQARRELEEQSHTRWAMLDLEKHRSGKLKQELDQLRASLPQSHPAYRAVSRPPPELHDEPFAVDRGDDTLLVDPVLPKRSDQSPVSGRHTMPIPDRPAANVNEGVPAPAQTREGTAYSFSEIEEEQVFVSTRAPQKGSGSRGPR